jgi:hypothetical protein
MPRISTNAEGRLTSMRSQTGTEWYLSRKRSPARSKSAKAPTASSPSEDAVSASFRTATSAAGPGF